MLIMPTPLLFTLHFGTLAPIFFNLYHIQNISDSAMRDTLACS